MGLPIEEIRTPEEEAERKRRKAEKRALKKRKLEALEVDEVAAKKSKKEKKNKKEKKEKKDKKDKKEKKKSKRSKENMDSSSDSCSSDVEKIREKLDITVNGEGDSTFAPVTRFEDAGMPDMVMKCTSGFKTPSPVQAQSWPIMTQGRDVVAIAATGSGKTLAFALPAMTHILTNNTRKIQVLVLAPTRELASQIHTVCEQVGNDCNIKTACVYGGVSKHEQRSACRGASMVVATPGRLLDLMEEGVVDLSHVDMLVLDEADRMLDMGFERDIRRIIATTPTARQTVMFSATWPESVRKLASEFQKSPVRVTVGSTDLAANHAVTQVVEVVEPADKERRLQQLLQQYHSSRTNRVLVFCLYKKEAARVENTLRRRGWNVGAIHGDMTQHERNTAFEAFKKGSKPLLVATDVAARGLDIPNVECVINVTFPLTIEDYVHRIGRTGRAGKTGTSHTLFTVQDKTHAGALQNVLREAGQTVPEALLKFGCGVKKKSHKMYGEHFNEDMAGQTSKKITFDSDDDE